MTVTHVNTVLKSASSLFIELSIWICLQDDVDYSMHIHSGLPQRLGAATSKQACRSMLSSVFLPELSLLQQFQTFGEAGLLCKSLPAC